MKLPVQYEDLDFVEKKRVREEYMHLQHGMCMFCKAPLDFPPPQDITDKKINWSLFPEGFLKFPIHLQHNHDTGLTEGAVHAYCNAVSWQYHGR